MLVPNQERIKLLVDALRSGEFKQGHMMLSIVKGDAENPETKHCCLGVACQVAMRNGLPLETTLRLVLLPGEGDEPVETIAYRNRNEASYASFTNAYLPEDVKDWFGFHGVSPAVMLEDGYETSAVDANDGLGMSFEEIADAFERMYLLNNTDIEH